MADHKKPMDRARALLTGAELPKPEAQKTTAERFLEANEASQATAEMESAARAGKAVGIRAKLERNDQLLSRLTGELNHKLVSLVPPPQGRFYYHEITTDPVPQLFFGKPPGVTEGEYTLRNEEIERMKQAFDMYNTAKLNGTLVVAKSADGQSLLLRPISDSANLPIIEGSYIVNCFAPKDAGIFLNLCIDIDAFNRGRPGANAVFSGSTLWSEFRKQHPNLKTIENAGLGGAKFSGYDLSGLVFKRSAILRNASFTNSDISGTDFSQSQGIMQLQFDGAGGDANTKYPAFIDAVKPAELAAAIAPKRAEPPRSRSFGSLLEGLGDIDGEPPAEGPAR